MADLLTSEQLRAARAILRLEQRALSEASKVSLATIKRLEATRGELIANRPTIAALQNALESAGVVFIAENGGGPGVRLRDPRIDEAQVIRWQEGGCAHQKYRQGSRLTLQREQPRNWRTGWGLGFRRSSAWR